MKGDGIDGDEAQIADVAPSIKLRVGVDPFPVCLPPGDADAITISGNGRKVENANQMMIFCLPYVRNNALLVVLAINPGKSPGKMIPFPEGRVLPVELTQVHEKFLKTLAHRVGLQVPI